MNNDNYKQMELPIYKLVINEDDDTGVEFVSLVTNPAIERDFQYFNEQKFESYNDYPKAASQNAQRGMRLNEAVDNMCATLVGKNRAAQLSKGENISLETVKRVYSYLSRAKEYYDPKDTKACGTISYLLWGGDEMLRWSERKLEELELRKAKKKRRKYDALPDYITEGLPLFDTKEEAEAYADKIGCTGSHQMGERWMPCSAEEAHNKTESKMHSHKVGFAIQDEEKRIITGAAMIADKPIYRYDQHRGEYYVVFDKDSIWQIAKKWAKTDRYDSVNIHHEDPTAGLSLLESFIVDREQGKYPPKGYDEVADGSWFLSYIVNDDDIWARVKAGEFKGFSVEGFFDFEEDPDEVMLNRIKETVAKWNREN